MAAPPLFFFENGDSIFFPCQTNGASQSGRSGTHHGNGLFLGWKTEVSSFPGGKAYAGFFQLSHIQGFVAKAFALAAGAAGLRAKLRGNGGEEYSRAQIAVGGRPPASRHLFQKSSDVQMEGAGAGTGGGFVMEAVLHKGFGILQFHL